MTELFYRKGNKKKFIKTKFLLLDKLLTNLKLFYSKTKSSIFITIKLDLYYINLINKLYKKIFYFLLNIENKFFS